MLMLTNISASNADTAHERGRPAVSVDHHGADDGDHATVPVFHGPDLLCKLMKFLQIGEIPRKTNLTLFFTKPSLLQVIPMYASSFLLIAISADRFRAICWPLVSMKSNAYKRPALYAGAAWTLALLFSTPQFVLLTKSEGDCLRTYTSPYQITEERNIFKKKISYKKWKKLRKLKCLIWEIERLFCLHYALYVTAFNTVVWLPRSALAGYLYFCVCRADWRSTSFNSNFHSKE
ncbi:unnamed protein product [Angiostrongylus costaricensis]|uniref:G_PROTEIN_RECEP_F1_2 domain-containing protein n=1 Tax=Angiostrongylus costaricensis TaxID=334426 RepID=A0A0R3PKV4_ANGCS|nr:unnamed protein product [Angiostrongylus costaricensis]